jgi:regulator of sigma E protease
MEVLIMAAQMLLALSILVGIHEWGHMFAAKMFGMRVEKFSIGFPPKVFGFKRGETEYMLGMIPLGGFVKISGMIDESLDTAQISAPPEPWEFRAKPAWQRLIVMLGGIIMNVILGIVIFILMVYFLGAQYIPIERVNQFGIQPSELGKKEIGFQDGDKIVGMNGAKLDHFDDIHKPDLLLASGSYYTVLRNGSELQLPIPVDLLDRMSEQKTPLATPMYEKYNIFVQITRLPQGMPAQQAGIKENDVVLAINGQEVKLSSKLISLIEKYKDQQITIQVRRGSQVLDIPVKVSPEGKIGAELQQNMDVLLAREYFTFAQSIPLGATKAFAIVTTQLQAFGKMFRGELSPMKSLGGPLAIAEQFGGQWNWVSFWTLTGLLSMVLAFMNLLPIPALDGGHVVFITYEMISGRKPSDKFLENAQKVGMVLLLALMVFVFGNDIYKIATRVIGQF